MRRHRFLKITGTTLLVLSVLAHASPSFASTEVCLSRPFLETRLPQALNRNALALLAEVLREELKVGGSPRASLGGLELALGAETRGRAPIKLRARSVRYSALFSGIRAGVVGDVSVQAELRVGRDKDEKNVLKLIPLSVENNFRIEMGGTIGGIVAKLLDPVRRAFFPNGRISQEILKSLETITLPLATQAEHAPLQTNVLDVHLTSDGICYELEILGET